MTLTVVKDDETPVVRSLKELAALIKEDLRQGDEAVKNAGMPYYRAAGEKMLEAKAQLPHGQFKLWIDRNFKIGVRQTQQYMALARATSDMEMRVATRISEPSTFRGAVHTYTTNVNYGKPASWRDDAKENIERARQQAARFAEETLTRQQERDAERALALQLITIGFKALASKLHPDKGGSRDAMQRLNRVRDRLKQHA
jgi:hypothetical protein